jgi:cob(I)alamin adenosyltransferase
LSSAQELLEAANHQIAGFLDGASGMLPQPQRPWTALTQIQIELTAIFATIANVRQTLDESRGKRTDRAGANAQISLYAANLERLRDFILTLQQLAGARRERIAAGTQQVNDALAWCRTLKLTALK